MKILKEYQENAINKLLQRTKTLLNEEGNETIIFQAPTGSGKTFMMTKYISQLVKSIETDICFLWVSIGKGDLHLQSYKSIKEELDSSLMCSLLEEEYFGTKDVIDQNEVVVLNWEKVRAKDKKTGEWKNRAMKDGETYNFIEVLQNTRKIDRKIILIIDESHYSSTSERAKEIRDEIVRPELTIEMSATPIIKEYDSLVKVNPIDVINAGMIKKEILINPEIYEIDYDELTSQELVLEAAYQKRIELAELYKKEESPVNPLVLIQLPNAVAGAEKREFIEKFLDKKGITANNKKVAVWLSEEPIEIELGNLASNDSPVEYLIFKQAIDTGWDCPRAQILVRFRETKSIVFEIQTLGRILRMPEAKHYDNDKLNASYVYTNLQSIDVKKETYNPNIIKTMCSKRKDIYTSISLRSYYRPRLDYGYITSAFYKVYEDVFVNRFSLTKDTTQDYEKNKKLLQDNGIELEQFKEMDTIVSDINVDSTNIDSNDTINFEGDNINVNYAENDLQNMLDQIVKDNLNGFAPLRSIITVKEAMYKIFARYLGLKKAKNGIIYLQNIIVKNKEIFSQILDISVKKYKDIHREIVEEKSGERYNNEWEIVQSKNYNPVTHTKYNSSLALYDPFYIRINEKEEVNKLEKEFIKYLEDKKDKIEWIWQNGAEHQETNFGIRKADGTTFQPDFIVKFKDGRIGIFDTKAAGEREDDNEIKATALRRYIEEETLKGKNLIGGLVIKDGNHFKINLNEEYKPYTIAPSEWEFFENIF